MPISNHVSRITFHISRVTFHGELTHDPLELKALETKGNPIRVGVSGAGWIGSGFVAQVAHVPGMDVTVLADAVNHVFDVYLDGVMTACTDVAFFDPGCSSDYMQAFGGGLGGSISSGHYDNARLFTVNTE